MHVYTCNHNYLSHFYRCSVSIIGYYISCAFYSDSEYRLVAMTFFTIIIHRADPPRNVKITVKREEEVTIKWKSVVQGTCCFSIEVGPPPPLSSQDICYVGEVYNDTWICSMNGSVVLHIESSIGKEVPDDCSGDLQRIANLPLPCASSDAITLSSMEQLPQATIIVLPSTLVTTTPSKSSFVIFILCCRNEKVFDC